MAKSNKNRRRAPRKTKRMVRRARPRGITSYPPLVSFNKQLLNTTLRFTSTGSFQVDSLIAHDFTVKTLFTGYPQLVSCFKELKIIRAKVWITPAAGMNSAGFYTICVTPHDLINPSETFTGLSSNPGSMTRKVFQPLHGSYFPTEPDERNWFPASSDKHLFVVQLMANSLDASGSTNQTKIAYQLVCDVHMRFRGRVSTVKNELDFELISGMDGLGS